MATTRKLKRIKSLTIKRSKWLRGDAGASCMRNDSGHMCCLGFLCLRMGVLADQMTRHKTPFSVSMHGMGDIPRLMERGAPTEFCNAAMSTNDRPGREPEREAALRKLFADNGIRLRFVP